MEPAPGGPLRDAKYHRHLGWGEFLPDDEEQNLSLVLRERCQHLAECFTLCRGIKANIDI